MTYEQKLQALQALTMGIDVGLYMRHPGDWFVYMRGVEIAKEHTLCTINGNGSSPELAVIKAWESATKLEGNEHLIVTHGGTTSRVKWNGFMWQPVIS